MRTVILLGSILISISISKLPGADQMSLGSEVQGLLAIVLIGSIAMDIVDFFRGK